ncbi:PadR family transcriptional regulator [Geosporobacter ferrireducens]|uniref:Transcription regulator PadR N-terminal domain-containing protein n=1 Tax=Geosporobacter ferrireducens TaxID=1424294 RepID=A0A1D8GI89_9FIRM|nr:PadR family transcriptional regulator [Geosporobacter ferrireducens]AOT70592.1 hypothetical protein Gferi_14035 [Geosporobacter ferrireducens]MTI57384.1 PadR family transcriptional regulator [Geosporobacter ferrireducens]
MSRIIVLGLLFKSPMHGYEMQQILQEERIDLWANLLPNSIYFALKQMQKEGFVKVRNTEKTGHRTRVIYEITEEGKKEFFRLLKGALGTPFRRYPADIYTSLSFLNVLPKSEIRVAIQKNISSLEKDISLWERGKEKKTKHFSMKEPLNAIFENGIEHIKADLKLLYYIKDNLETILNYIKECDEKGEI